MSEANSIERAQSLTGRPATRESLAAELSAAGLEAGETVCVHASLSALGWVVGGAPAVIGAIEDVLGVDGTLVMPCHSSGNSDPSIWRNPPVPEAWWQTIRDHMPAFDRALTPPRMMGAIAETYLARAGVRRSLHPSLSFTARGPRAEAILADHELDFPSGEGSPLARLYEERAQILLLGTGYDSCSLLHLAECRADYPEKTEIESGAAMMVDGKREWVTFRDVSQDWEERFPEIGASFENLLDVPTPRVGCADVHLVQANLLVDFAVGWIEARSVSDRTAALRAERDAAAGK